MSRQVAVYPSQLVVRPGDDIGFHAHADRPLNCAIDCVRIIQGDPALPLDLPVAASIGDGQIAVHPQLIAAGSFAHVTAEQSVMLESFSLGLALMPTRLPPESAGVLALRDGSGTTSVSLQIDAQGCLAMTVRAQGRAEVLRLPRALPLRRWAMVSLSLDAAVGMITAGVRIIGEGQGDPCGFAEVFQAIAPLPFALSDMLIASDGKGPSFDGKIDALRVSAEACSREEIEALVEDPSPEGETLVSAIDFAHCTGTPLVASRTGPIWTGSTRNLPSRGVKGLRWDGTVHDWQRAPEHYGAAHFRSDDIYDMAWESSTEWAVPADLRSGAYAARITDPDGGRAYATFFVEPNGPCNEVVFLASTATYLAYANETVFLRLPQMLYGVTPPPPDDYMPLINHPEFGGSLYEHHADGSGVRTSSWLRPLVNLRPESRMWSFNADTAITAWLERVAPGFDTVTDHGLHARGVAALEGARVVVTGTHPEYVSDEMLDALEAFLARGGRLIYMGGNGFYWRTALSPHFPAAVEIRRAEDGTRAWIEEPGEYHHEFDGRLGGLWRRCGRPPNRLVGVGFAAQGFITGAPYHRAPGADDPRARFILEDVEGDVFGAHGARGGGAASEEIDRWDPLLGSPPHALIIASSKGHGPDMLKVKEEFHATMPMLQDADTRADLTFFETRAGGAVFATGSIGWAGALATCDYENDVARITGNVLARFRSPEPFVWPEAGQ